MARTTDKIRATITRAIEFLGSGVTLPEGTIVLLDFASNQPEGGDIAWWIAEIISVPDGTDSKKMDRLRRTGGIGLGHDDVLIDGYTLDPFTRAYAECALWSSTDDDGEPLDRDRDVREYDPADLSRMAEDCARFQQRHGHLWRDGETSRGEWAIDRYAGHDYWLTRNGHGAGFWDREDHVYCGNADTLSEIAKKAGTVDLCVTDSGTIEIV